MPTCWPLLRSARALAPPWDSGPGLAFLRHHLRISPELALFLASVDGRPVGCGAAGTWVPGDASDYAPGDASVLPPYRHRGVGTALLRAVSAHARDVGRRGLTVEVREDDSATLAFAARRGYAEVERQKAVVLELDDVPARAVEPPPGVEIVTRAERDDLGAGMYAAALEAGRDIPGLDGEHEPTYEEWSSFELDRPGRRPELCFLALVDDEVVGFASLEVGGGIGYHGLTAVRPAHRRRGIARALKLSQIAAARELGLPRLVTESEEHNEPMRRLNASLGYRAVPGMVVLQGPLIEAG